MATTDLTTTASVRAVLGVSEKEIRDDVLLDPIFSSRLTEDVHALHPDLFDDFVVAAGASPRTTLQQRFYDLVQTYSAYRLASYCLGSVGMFAPVVIKDSRSELNRTPDPFKQLRVDVLATLPILRTNLLTVYSQVNPAAPAPSAIERLRVIAAPLGINPVTGA